MEKYSREWKLKQGAWIQDHINSQADKIYKIHYIEHDTERMKLGEFFTMKDAREALAEFKAASALGRKGGSAKSPRKAASSRANGAKGGRPRKV